MMEGWHLALLLKPLGLLAIFAPGAVIVYFLRRRLPHGLIRRVLLFSWRV